MATVKWIKFDERWVGWGEKGDSRSPRVSLSHLLALYILYINSEPRCVVAGAGAGAGAVVGPGRDQMHTKAHSQRGKQTEKWDQMQIA